jgi:alanine--tRNA ligase
LVVATNERARELTLDAGALLRVGLAHVDGRGGGKADIAQGGGTKPEGIAAGLAAIRSEIESL